MRDFRTERRKIVVILALVAVGHDVDRRRLRKLTWLSRREINSPLNSLLGEGKIRIRSGQIGLTDEGRQIFDDAYTSTAA